MQDDIVNMKIYQHRVLRVLRDDHRNLAVLNVKHAKLAHTVILPGVIVLIVMQDNIVQVKIYQHRVEFVKLDDHRIQEVLNAKNAKLVNSVSKVEIAQTAVIISIARALLTA